MEFFNFGSSSDKLIDKSINNRPTETEDDFLNELMNEQPLPNEIRYNPNAQNNQNITREEFVQMQLANAQSKKKAIKPIDLKNQLAKKRLEEKLEQEDLDMLHEYILTGKIVQKVQILDTDWYMHVLSVQESRAAIQRAEAYNAESQQLAQALFVLSYALERIDNHYFYTFEETRSFLEKMSIFVIYHAVNKYNDIFARQSDVMAEPQQIRALIQDDFLRIKYQVMRNSGLVPSDPRVAKMSDAQWLWYYYNMDEDMENTTDIRQSELDYLGVFINPKMAQEMIKINEQNRKKRKAEKEKAFKKYKKRTTKRRAKIINDTLSTTKKAHNTKQHNSQNITDNAANNDFKDSLSTDNFLQELQEHDNVQHVENTNSEPATQDISNSSLNNNMNSMADTDDFYEFIANNTTSTKQDNATNHNETDTSDDNAIDEELSQELADDTDTYDSSQSILDNVFGSSVYQGDNTVINDAFEQELRAALQLDDNKSLDDQFVELADDTSAGNPYESPDDFYERVHAFLPFAGTNYGYVKPEKMKVSRVSRKKASNIEQPTNNETRNDADKAELLKRGLNVNMPLNMQSNDIISNNDPKWKQESDLEFRRKTGINARALNKMNVNTNEELKKLTDNMDFFEVDDD